MTVARASVRPSSFLQQAVRAAVVALPCLWLAATAPVAGAAGFSSLVPPPKPDPSALAPVKVRDLHYGDVLFEFYQDDFFDSLVKLTAYREQGHLSPHAAEAELLLGGLYLSLGQHKEAGRIFQAVLDRPDVPPGVRDRARFYLAKVWYQRGYLEQAEAVFQAAGNALPPALQAEMRMLHAQSLLYQGKFDAAIALLDGWQGPPEWRGYARFNLGIALVRSDRLEDGVRQLEAVGTAPASRAEAVSLRDKANLALGYAFLQANQPERARVALERVRLEGPLSTKALLGVGWADAALGKHEEALVPWLELHGRNLLDAAVQESYLAVPYAYAKLGADAQAAEQYEVALREFGAETARLDESITSIRAGLLVDAIVKNDQRGDYGWFWQLKQLPDAPESRYLYHLLAGHEFQEGLKNYRSLLFMQRNLEGWLSSVEAYDDMIATRRQRFAERLPEVLANLEGVSVESLQQRHTTLASRLSAAETQQDGVALGTAREREVWDTLTRMEATFAAHPDDKDLVEARDKHRLLKGVMQWRLSEQFKARAWAVRRDLRETQAALRDTEKGWALVADAKTAVPARNEDYAARIALLRPRIADALARLEEMKGRQAQYLSSVAIRELESQQARISEYEVQARFALATIYDRAMVAPAPGAKPPAAPGEDAPAEEGPVPVLAPEPGSTAEPATAPAPEAAAVPAPVPVPEKQP